MSEPELLRLDEVTVSYGSVTAVRDVSFQLGAGQVMALLGPNGAGKSSILKGVAGVASTAGRIEFNGRNINRRSPHRRVRDGIATVPQGRRVFADMTVEENLLVSLRGRGPDRAERLSGVYAQFPRLRERSGVRAGYLSGGEQQMLALGRALMSHPKLILLDEPSLGLAPKMVTNIFDKIREITAQNVAAIIVDQNAVQAMALATRVCVVHRGELVYDAPVDQAREELDIVHAHLGMS
jgi:branched-chain amino acid transport system ATP-binding protein